jgi:D-3-phosphoglycerate dehydrogenase
MVVRHYNRVGVLASVLAALREEHVNVEEMDNTIFEGGAAAICCLHLDDRPSDAVVQALSDDAAILQVLVGAEPEAKS